jgi:hypothetical protein
MKEDCDDLYRSKERRVDREIEMWVCVQPIVKREENAKAQMQSS